MKTIREFIDEDITWDEWLDIKLKIQNEVDKFSDILQKFTSSSNGIISDEIMKSDKYKKAKKGYDVAFKKLQQFNSNKNYKKYSKRKRDEKRNKWKL